MSFKKNTVYFVGAGPGDVELITVKGARLLEKADRIIYAGSLVNPELFSFSTCEKYDSKGLHLDQIVELMEDGVRKKQLVVRLHTGDPSVYGAIKEQMDQLDKRNIQYEVVPGVSSAFAAAASLKKELTLPEISQTVIITRMAGRTPVPAGESIQSLASHKATMMIFLSVGMIDDVVKALVAGGMEKQTPVYVVQKASWDDELVIGGTLETISKLVERENISKTAMICVGRVFADKPAEYMSKLYDKSFSHGTRESSNE